MRLLFCSATRLCLDHTANVSSIPCRLPRSRRAKPIASTTAPLHTLSRSMAAVQQPPWSPPSDSLEPRTASIRVYNSLTRTKTPFYPIKDKRISWYACGPTVYDDAVCCVDEVDV